MREGWESTTLDNVCQFENGDRGKNYPGRKAFVTTGIPFINAGHLGDGEIDWKSMNYIPRKNYEILGNGKVQKGDLLFCLRGSLGKFGVVEKEIEGAIASSLVIVRPTDRLNPDFLSAYFRSDICSRMIAKYANGAAQPNLSAKSLKSFEIPLPTPHEQQRIVAILDEAFEGIDAAIANTQKNLSNARELFENYLHSILLDKKWEWKKLKDLCNGVEYGTSAKSQKEGKIPVLRMGNIQDGQIDWKNLVYTDDENEIEKYLLKHDDVLFNRTNSPELVGKTAIYKSEMPAAFAGYLIRIHRKEDLLDGDYLSYFLNSQIARDYGKTVVISSVNQANINGTKLKGYPIPAPSISEQRLIVEKLNDLQEETMNLETIYQQKLTSLKELKQSLLAKAFSGELTAGAQQVLKEAVG